MSENPKRPGRNDRCPCGSGKKYKHCCLAKDAAADRAARAAAAAPASDTGTDSEAEPGASRRHADRQRRGDQTWKRDHPQARGFQKRSGPRNRGGGS